MDKFSFHSELQSYEQRPTYKLMGKFLFHYELQNIWANPIPFQVSKPTVKSQIAKLMGKLNAIGTTGQVQ